MRNIKTMPRPPTIMTRDVATHATPVIKWVGGKSRLLPELVKRAPPKFERYFEPFAGGAALFFHLAPKHAVLSDSNADLINLYAQLAASAEPLIRRLRVHQRSHSKRYYYALRERWNDTADKSWTPVARAAAFVYLNKTCFNGLWRVNRAGEFNVPIGRYDEPVICDPPRLRAAQAILGRAELRSGGYFDAVADASRDDFVYFDPPYDPASETSSFTGYSASGFTRWDQHTLRDLANLLIARGCTVMLSNSDTRFVRDLYKGFRIDDVTRKGTLNSDVTKRSGVGEVIISGKPVLRQRRKRLRR